MSAPRVAPLCNLRSETQLWVEEVAKAECVEDLFHIAPVRLGEIARQIEAKYRLGISALSELKLDERYYERCGWRQTEADLPARS